MKDSLTIKVPDQITQEELSLLAMDLRQLDLVEDVDVPSTRSADVDAGVVWVNLAMTVTEHGPTLAGLLERVVAILHKRSVTEARLTLSNGLVLDLADITADSLQRLSTTSV